MFTLPTGRSSLTDTRDHHLRRTFVYICIHLYTFVFVYCVFVYLCICVFVYLYICIFVYLYICIFVYLYICIIVFVYLSVVHCPIVTSGYCPILLHCRSTLPNCPRVKQGNQASASICTFYLQSLSSSVSSQLSLDACIWHI